MKKLIDQLHAARQSLDQLGYAARQSEAVSEAIRLLESGHPGQNEAFGFREYQSRSLAWAEECFGPVSPHDQEERRNRMLEEALELFQASGGSVGEANELANYVYGRPAGEVKQEAGGLGLTLSLLCTAHEVDLSEALLSELARVHGKISAIRAKQAARPKGSPLPGPSEPRQESS